eukprot:7254810-Karenia_brevis.AAC.1
MKAKWDELPISEIQYDYEMLAFVKSVKHGNGHGCVVGRAKANNKITNRIDHDFRSYAIFDFCH